MDPYKHETTAELIVRKPGRLNILVTKIQWTPGGIRDGWITREPSGGHSVQLRYGWTALDLGEDDNRPVGRWLPVKGERFDPDAINMLHRPGAFVSIPDVDGIRAAIAEIQEVWGPLHVQDNSGLVPDLHQGLWNG